MQPGGQHYIVLPDKVCTTWTFASEYHGVGKVSLSLNCTWSTEFNMALFFIGRWNNWSVRRLMYGQPSRRTCHITGAGSLSTEFNMALFFIGRWNNWSVRRLMYGQPSRRMCHITGAGSLGSTMFINHWSSNNSKNTAHIIVISMSHVMRQFSLSLLNIKGLADCNLLFLSAMIGLDTTSLQHYFVTYSSQHLWCWLEGNGFTSLLTSLFFLSSLQILIFFGPIFSAASK